MPIRLIAAVLCLVCFNARADWADFSVSYRCDKQANIFSLSPIVETSGDFNIPLAEGYQKLEQGKSSFKLQCQLKQHIVTLDFLSLGPQASGMCRGIGFTWIHSLNVDGQQLISAEGINSGCFFEDTLVSMKLYLETSHFTIERCTAKEWDGNEGYKNHKCAKERSALTLHPSSLPPVVGTRLRRAP